MTTQPPDSADDPATLDSTSGFGRQTTVPLDRFELLEPLGRGASATVYRARDTVIGRIVALKRLDLLESKVESQPEGGAIEGPGAEMSRRLPSTPMAAAARERFLSEARHAGALSHPNIVTVYDIVEDEDRPGTLCLAMEFVDGIDLRQALQQNERTDLDTVVSIVGQVASALDYLHEEGFVHCDLKPANLLLTRDGRVKLTDFGIAQQISVPDSEDTDVFGTPAYMAPERLLGDATGPRAEVYSLGVMIFEMLTRRRPFEAPSVERLIYQLVNRRPTPLAEYRPELGPRLGPVLEKALARDAADRYPTAGSLAKALSDAIASLRQDRALAETESTIVLDPTLLNRLRASFKRRRWLAAMQRFRLRPPHLAMLLLVGIVVGIVLTLNLLRSGVGDDGADEARRAVMAPPDLTDAEAARKMLERGRTLLEAGEPEVAILLFEAASYIEPSLVEVAEQALARAREQIVTDQEPPDEPPRRPAREVVESVREVLDGRDDLVELEGVLAILDSATQGPSDDPSDQEAFAEQAFLMLDVQSEAPRGTVTLYVDGSQRLLRPFRFYRRGRLFFNKKPTGGQFQEVLEVPPSGSRKTPVGVYIQREGEAAMLFEVEVDLVAGNQPVLDIEIPLEGEPTIVLR